MALLDKIEIAWDDQDRPLITVQYTEASDDEQEGRPEEWLPALAESLGDKSARYLRRLIDVNGTRGAVKLTELAAELDTDKNDVDGWNRNLGRSIKRVVREHGFLRLDEEDGTAQLFDFEWDKADNAWRYVVPEKFRATLVESLDAR